MFLHYFFVKYPLKRSLYVTTLELSKVIDDNVVMDNLIRIDFKAGRRLTDKDVSHTHLEEGSALRNAAPVMGPLEADMIARLNKQGIAFPEGFDFAVYDKLSARYGDEQPRGSVIYKTPIERVKGVVYVDTYGRGCVHDVSGTSKRCGGGHWKALLESKNMWNQPMPFPSDIVALFSSIKNVEAITLGRRSDAFMWMDQKYKVTLALLENAYQYGVQHITIDTRSDLVAHDTYLDALKRHASMSGHSVKVNVYYTTTNEHALREREVGCPSFKRRKEAVERLIAAGIDARLVKERV